MSQPRTLISHALCPYVQRAVIALTEKGVACERVYAISRISLGGSIRFRRLARHRY